MTTVPTTVSQSRVQATSFPVDAPIAKTMNGRHRDLHVERTADAQHHPDDERHGEQQDARTEARREAVEDRSTDEHAGEHPDQPAR